MNSKLLTTFAFCLLTFDLLTSPTLAQSPNPTSSTQLKDSTPSTSVREKVRQTIENLVRKPRAVIGTLEQITDSTLAIKTKNGKSQMVAAGSATTYAKLTGGKKSDIKFQDLAIGDFTIALGYKNGNDILDAKRVLTFDKQPTPSRKVIYGTVQSVAKNSFVLKLAKTGEAWTIQLTSKTKLTAKGLREIKAEDIIEGDKAVVVGIPDDKKDKTLKAVQVHILSLKAISAKPSPNPKPSPTTSPTP